MKSVFLFVLMVASPSGFAQVSPKIQRSLDQEAKEIESKVIVWRRYFHQNPELSNREAKTGTFIADQLKSFGIEVKHPFAKTGVIGILKGAMAGPVIALRADIDALPVTERNSLPFASKAKTIFNGQETGVMHACGHDSHMAILLGVAEILARHKSDLKGTVKFLFQPAEEGPPPGEEGGAALMIKEGALENPKVDVIFGLHIQSLVPLGTIHYRSGAFMASPGFFRIKVTGKQAHGATPWDGIDPIVVSSQIVAGLQTIVSRQTELTTGAAVITVGSLHSGIRGNILPEDAIMEGTTRTFDPAMQKILHEKIELTARKIAESAGATAETTFRGGYRVTYNDPELTEAMVPSLIRAAGEQNTRKATASTMAEDFALYQDKVPGLFFFLGGLSPDANSVNPPVHHTPDFMIDERSFGLGIRAFLNLTFDYMNMSSK